MHKDWIKQACNNAPDNIDDNMTISEFVDKYSSINQLTNIALKLNEIFSKNKE